MKTKARYKRGSLFESFATGLPGTKEYAGLIVKAALAEDIGSGDITTEAIASKGQRCMARIVAKEGMVVAGLFLAESAFRCLDAGIGFNALIEDGGRAKKDDVIAEVSGTLKAVLAGERVAINFLQRLSGIATLTSRFVSAVSNAKAKVLDTRKTTPCLRVFEKYAVRVGGGFNHRFGLFDCVLIKDNHIAAAGGVREALSMVERRYKGNVLVEVEAKTLREVKDALSAGADIIMLDNMKLPDIRRSVEVINGRAVIEASGGVTLSNIRGIARTGVHFISIGMLTHSAKAVDISMEVMGHGHKG